jgi:hypothetical protein
VNLDRGQSDLRVREENRPREFSMIVFNKSFISSINSEGYFYHWTIYIHYMVKCRRIAKRSKSQFINFAWFLNFNHYDTSLKSKLDALGLWH